MSSPTITSTSSPTVLQLAWGRYRTQLQQRPLRTKALTSACISGLSDVIAQQITNGGKSYDWTKTLKMALFGLVWAGPSAHYWQDLMAWLFCGKQGPSVPIEKVAFDQLTYGPLCNLVFMAYTALVVGGQTPAQVRDKVSRDFFSVQQQGWKLWPVVGLVNYKFVPIQYRVLVINLAALFWSTFLILRSRGATSVLKRA